MNGSYEMTRHNSLRWGIAVDGPIPCRRTDCAYREECDIPDPELPVIGEPCPVEIAYARRIAADFRRHYGYLADAGCLADFDDLVAEATNIMLARERVTVRTNRSWTMCLGQYRSSFADSALINEFNLTDRYYAALANRWMAVLEKLELASSAYAHRQARLKAMAFGLHDTALMEAGTQ